MIVQSRGFRPRIRMPCYHRGGPPGLWNGVASEMAKQEHPDESPRAEGRERAAASRPPSGGTEARGEGDARPTASSSSAKPAASGGQSAAGEVPVPSPACEAPAPGPASMDPEAEHGVRGALVLWGPLIIIGFLVLVLGADDARRAVSRDEGALGQDHADAVVAEPVPAALVVAGEAIRTVSDGPAETMPEAGAEGADPASPEAGAGAADPASPEAGAGAAPATEEAGEPAATLPGPLVEETSEGAGTGAAAPPGSSAVDEGSSAPTGLDLAALLTAAGITLPQGSNAASPAAGAVEEEIPAAPVGGEPGESIPAPPLAPGASALAGAGSGGEPAGGPRAPSAGMEHPPWAPPPFSQGGVMWGSNAGSEARGAAAESPWRPTAEGPPTLASGPSGWPPRPILVPCVPPYYWCIALPIPVLVPTPPSAY